MQPPRGLLLLLLLPLLLTPTHDRPGVSKERRFGDVPLVGGEEEDVSAGAVHLVGLPWMNGLLLHRFNLQGIQLLVKHLHEETPPIITIIGSCVDSI